MSIEYAALESGLDRFVRPDKGDFVGREGLLGWRERGFGNAFVTLAVDGPGDADPLGNNPLYVDGELAGRSTSGNYGFRLEQSLALAMVRPEIADVGTALEIEILGARYPARVVEESPYDPENRRLRA
jgi:dimethylglycine dehydrogenase